MNQVFVIVYAKGSKIKVLSPHEANRLQGELVKEGWSHTQTLDACTYIAHLHNNCGGDELAKELGQLNNTE